MPGRNLDEMAQVRSRIDVPVLANEASWTRFDQLAVLTAGAADAISVDNQILCATQAYMSLLSGDVLAGNPLDPRDGTLAVPTGPGLGVDLDPERVAEYAEEYARPGPHLCVHRQRDRHATAAEAVVMSTGGVRRPAPVAGPGVNLWVRR